MSWKLIPAHAFIDRPYSNVQNSSVKMKCTIDDEQQLLIKCKTQDFAKIQHCIQENHSYEIPEIIQIPISAGLPEYFQWLENVR